jgi:MFS family permease
MLYLVSQNLVFMTVVNFLGGIIWAGLTLGLQNYVFDIVAPKDRAKGVAVMNSLNAIGWFAGALLGSWMAVWAPSVVSVAGYTLSLASNLPVVFFISGLLRLVVSLSLLRTFREGRSVESITHRQLVLELPLIKPLAAAFSGRIVRQP